MGHGPRPSRRELFKLVGLAAGLAVVGGSAAACGELDSEQESALIETWRHARADVTLAESAKGRFDPESPEDRALARVVEARVVHRDKLVEAIEAAGEELPIDEEDGAESESGATPSPVPSTVTTLEQVVESLTASGSSALGAAAVLEGYSSALAGSVGAACSALAKVTLGVSLGRDS